MLGVGCRVDVKFNMVVPKSRKIVGARWYSGVIMAVRSDGYTVQYDESNTGGVDSTCAPQNVRRAVDRRLHPATGDTPHSEPDFFLLCGSEWKRVWDDAPCATRGWVSDGWADIRRGWVAVSRAETETSGDDTD